MLTARLKKNCNSFLQAVNSRLDLNYEFPDHFVSKLK